MDGYSFFGPDDARQARIGRIRQLESAHYRELLIMEEDANDQMARETMVEIERRINHHVGVLNGFVRNQQAEPEPEAPDEESSPTGG